MQIIFSWTKTKLFERVEKFSEEQKKKKKIARREKRDNLFEFSADLNNLNTFNN